MDQVELRRQWNKLQGEWSAANQKAREAELRVTALGAAAVRRGLAPSARDQAGARALRAVAEKYQVEMKKFVLNHLGR